MAQVSDFHVGNLEKLKDPSCLGEVVVFSVDTWWRISASEEGLMSTKASLSRLRDWRVRNSGPENQVVSER